MATLQYPIWETYERHVAAQRRDRTKHFPGASYTRHVTDTATWKTQAVRRNSAMPAMHPGATTADYVEAFCAANSLLQAGA
jgi:hypothetical protein